MKFWRWRFRQTANVILLVAGLGHLGLIGYYVLTGELTRTIPSAVLVLGVVGMLLLLNKDSPVTKGDDDD